MSKHTEHCGMCQFFRLPDLPISLADAGTKLGSLGECRRFPPRQPVGAFEATWSKNWCGEFKYGTAAKDQVAP